MGVYIDLWGSVKYTVFLESRSWITDPGPISWNLMNFLWIQLWLANLCMMVEIMMVKVTQMTRIMRTMICWHLQIRLYQLMIFFWHPLSHHLLQCHNWFQLQCQHHPFPPHWLVLLICFYFLSLESPDFILIGSLLSSEVAIPASLCWASIFIIGWCYPITNHSFIFVISPHPSQSQLFSPSNSQAIPPSLFSTTDSVAAGPPSFSSVSSI